MTVAEMPLIATYEKFRSKGMCRLLMNAIEKVCYWYNFIQMFNSYWNARAGAALISIFYSMVRTYYMLRTY